ncbi:HAD hydrolase-like protein [Roseibacillus persicicus]|uniref:Phosphoglycolate phosphatase n=1 Tax=Roseibacillus persicicus TaxID=454148 RepID=A0A918WM34_9BACT|nr:HAD hydrolase-like protein [Roseibacillus persicicus]MDQ8191903.1 HAD hydrolase-like protein [Roseibacillus persicicus]GHC58215.1 phosphoglycolate phosphatase [Roseibacillus persicicus]
MRYPALIFDFDGTLADTLAAAVDVYNDLAENYSLRPITMDEIPALQDFELKELLKHLGVSKLRVPSLLAKGRKALRADITTLSLNDGMEELLPKLREHCTCFGILTSNSTENVEAFLEAKGLRDLFTFISSTSKLSGKHKHLRAIEKTFSLERSKMLYIGDETRDVRASQKAGIHVAAATWGFNSRDALLRQNPTYMLDEPKDLLEVCSIS